MFRPLDGNHDLDLFQPLPRTAGIRSSRSISSCPSSPFYRDRGRVASGSYGSRPPSYLMETARAPRVPAAIARRPGSRPCVMPRACTASASRSPPTKALREDARRSPDGNAPATAPAPLEGLGQLGPHCVVARRRLRACQDIALLVRSGQQRLDGHFTMDASLLGRQIRASEIRQPAFQDPPKPGAELALGLASRRALTAASGSQRSLASTARQSPARSRSCSSSYPSPHPTEPRAGTRRITRNPLPIPSQRPIQDHIPSTIPSPSRVDRECIASAEFGKAESRSKPETTQDLSMGSGPFWGPRRGRTL